MTERLQYIDNAKGVMMLLVVFHHVAWSVCNIGIENDVFTFIRGYRYVYINFFMAFFFVITGYCSNFDKPVGNFVLSRVKSLLVPHILLLPLLMTMYGARSGYLHAYTHYCYGIWFLTAMFFAVVGYCFINKFSAMIHVRHQMSVNIILALICALLAIYLSNHHLKYNYWNWMQGMILMPFIPLGQIVRKYDLSKYAYAIAGFWILYQLLYKNKVSWVMNTIDVSLSGYCIMIIVSLAVSISLLNGCKRIQSRVLKYVGKNTLVIYLFHIPICCILANLLYGSIESATMVLSIGIYVMMFFVSLSISCLIAYILNLKYIKWVIGKF